jgi:hypothetical protein
MMKNFDKFYSKVSAMADEKLAVKKTKPAKGLLAKESMSDKKPKEDNDMYTQVA